LNFSIHTDVPLILTVQYYSNCWFHYGQYANLLSGNILDWHVEQY